MRIVRILSLFLAGILLLGGGVAWWKRERDVKPADSVAASTPHPQSQPDKNGTPPTRSSPPLSSIHFTSLSAKRTGIDFQHQSGTSAEKPFPAANGSGIAVLDFDLDGLYDLYFATGTPFPLDRARLAPINHLYRNRGAWRFEDVTAQSRLGYNGYSAGLAVGDYDNDGFPDVYVTCYGPNRLFHNQGDGTFTDVSLAAGVDDDRWATSAAFLDADNDGLLDLYVCNYAQWSLETNRFCGDRSRKVRIFCSPNSVPPEHDVFYHNEGDGTFHDATATAGLANRAGRGQGVIAADFNNDGRIDLYIGNDLHANSLFLNKGQGRFQDATEESGVAYDHLGRMQASMGVDAADVSRRGRLDLFVTNYEKEFNAFYENMGEASFQEETDLHGLGTAGLPWVGWGTVFADFDLDGWVDLIVTDGHTDDNLLELGREAPYEEPPLIWKNHDGQFELVGGAAGDYFSGRHVGRALAVVDLDNDGDWDVVIGHQDVAPALLRNDRLSPTGDERPCIRLRLVGTRSNRDAVGAALIVQTRDRPVVRQIKGGRSYLSAHDLRQVIAVGTVQHDVPVTVRWPNGRRTTLESLQSSGSYLVIEPRDPNVGPTVYQCHDPLIPEE